MPEELVEKEVFLIRHSESVGNALGVHVAADASLTRPGLDQSRALAIRVDRIPNLQAIICNTSARAKETAELISRHSGMRIEESSLFSGRRRPSTVQGRAHNDPSAMTIMSEIFQGYASPEHRHSDEENLDDLRVRANAALDFLRNYPAKNICVITHGSFLWVLFCAVFAGPNFSGIDLQRAIRSLAPDNAGVTRIVYVNSMNFISGEKKARWRLKSWSDLSHLD